MQGARGNTSSYTINNFLDKFPRLTYILSTLISEQLCLMLFSVLHHKRIMPNTPYLYIVTNITLNLGVDMLPDTDRKYNTSQALMSLKTVSLACDSLNLTLHTVNLSNIYPIREFLR